jgi:response regulator RpfG family c-di-GMP phosphodiesterase
MVMPAPRILVVDDEAAVRNIVATLLEHSGYRAVSADGAEAALGHLKADGAFDLVIADIMMPHVDGLTLLDRISVDFPGTPVVMLTAVHDIHVATNAFRRGAIDYLLKPFERAQLLSVVARAVDHGNLRRQNSTYRQNLEEMVCARTGRLRATMQDLERSYDITLEAMGDALDLRDAETEGHSRRVTAYTTALARAIGLNSQELRVIARGAFLHDIGKLPRPTPSCSNPANSTSRRWR